MSTATLNDPAERWPNLAQRRPDLIERQRRRLAEMPWPAKAMDGEVATTRPLAITPEAVPRAMPFATAPATESANNDGPPLLPTGVALESFRLDADDEINLDDEITVPAATPARLTAGDKEVGCSMNIGSGPIPFDTAVRVPSSPAAPDLQTDATTPAAVTAVTPADPILQSDVKLWPQYHRGGSRQAHDPGPLRQWSRRRQGHWISVAPAQG